MRTAYPDSLQTTATFLSAALLPDPQRLADTFLRDLERLGDPIVLVLDDYHAVQSPPVQAFMSRLVQHLPDNAHIAIIARSDPPLPLAQLRGRRQMVEVRTADLRFSTTEAGALVQEIAGEHASKSIAALLAGRTEGWPVGLYLASLSLRDSDDPVALAQRFSTRSDRLVADIRRHSWTTATAAVAGTSAAVNAVLGPDDPQPVAEPVAPLAWPQQSPCSRSDHLMLKP